MARSTVVRHETVVGAFVCAVAAVLATGLIIKGSRHGLGAREVVFATDAGHDLKQGAAVKMQGIEVGEVSDVRLLKDNTVQVHCKIFPPYFENVHGDAAAMIVEPPLLGSSSVEIAPGSKGQVGEGQTLTTIAKYGIVSRVEDSAEDVKKVVDKVNNMATKAEATLDSVATIARGIQEGKGVVGRLVKDEQLADDFVKGVKSMVAIADDVKEGRGAWAALKDETLAPNLRGVVADVRSMTDAVARGEGSLGRLMTNATVVVEAEGTLKDVRGALARLDEITKDSGATTKKVQDVLDTVRSSLTRLDGTIKNAEKVTGELVTITEKVNKGQGTLAKLVNDDAIFREAKALLKELRESVEDLREQAPINAFIGVVFSAF